MASKIFLYGDMSSQPARAIWILAKANFSKMGPYEEVAVNLSKGEQNTEWFRKIAPTGKAPALKVQTEGKEDFNMFESHAMMVYLCNSRKFDEHWYPRSDLEQ